MPQSKRLEGLAQKLRIFAAVVTEPAIPQRIGAHTVVGDTISGVGDDVLDGLPGTQAHAAAKELLRLNHLNPVYHGEHGLRSLKELVRSYLTITKDLGRVMSRVKAIYRSWGDCLCRQA